MERSKQLIIVRGGGDLATGTNPQAAPLRIPGFGSGA